MGQEVCCILMPKRHRTNRTRTSHRRVVQNIAQRIERRRDKPNVRVRFPMFSPNAKTRPPSRENGLNPDLPRRNRGAREPARHPRIDRNPHGGVAPLHCPAGQTVVMTVEYRDGIGVTPLLTKGSHVEIRGVGTCPATWNESATLPASSGNPAQVSIAGGVLLSPLSTNFQRTSAGRAASTQAS